MGFVPQPASVKNCFKCGHDNAEQAFCGKCGSPLQLGDYISGQVKEQLTGQSRDRDIIETESAI